MIYHAAEPMLVSLFGERDQLNLVNLSGDDLRLIRMMATMSPAQRQYVLAARPELMGVWATVAKKGLGILKRIGRRIGKSRGVKKLRKRLRKRFGKIGRRIRARIRKRRAARKGRSVKSVAAVVARNEAQTQAAQSAAAQQLVAQQTAARAAAVQVKQARTNNMLMVAGVGIAALTLLTLSKPKRG